MQSCIGAYAGDDGYNPGCDLNGDGTITQEEIDELTDYLNSIDPVDVTIIAAWDINDDWLIDNNDLEILKLYENYEVTENIAHLDVNQNGIIDSEDITAYTEYLNSTEAFLYMMDLNGDNVVNSDDIDYLSDKLNLRSRSLNYFEYMDIYSEDRTITIEDYNWFKEYCTQYSGYTSENSYKKNIKLTADCYVDGSFNLHDGNLDLNGYYLTVYDCMSFTTDNPNLWNNNTGAFLNVNSGD